MIQKRGDSSEPQSSPLTNSKSVEFVEELLYAHLRREQLVKRVEGDLGDRGGRLTIDVTRGPGESARPAGPGRGGQLGARSVARRPLDDA